MKTKLSIAEQLKEKYHKTTEVTNFKDMLYNSSENFKSRTAFKLKDKNGNIVSITYEEFKNDVVYLGTDFIKRGFLNKRIAVIGKNSYQWCVSYMAASIVGVVVPIDKELHCDDVINFMNVSESVCILGDLKNLTSIKENFAKLNNQETVLVSFDKIDAKTNDILYFDNLKVIGKDSYLNGFHDFDKIQVNPDELRILLFTSGTTGNA